MTQPGDGGACDAGASAAVGYTSQPKSSRRPSSGPSTLRPTTDSGPTRRPSSSASTSSRETTVAALFVERGGVYWARPGIEAWDLRANARLYPGPHPVVAHPPCARWSILGNCRPELAHLRGLDGGCFAAALVAVRTFGGVLEHPRHSAAWLAFDLPEPSHFGWTRSLLDPGWTTLVDQRLYGYPTRKWTWLYYVGANPPPSLRWDDPQNKRKTRKVSRDGNLLNVSNHHSQRSRTPPAFRDELVALARLSRAA